MAVDLEKAYDWFALIWFAALAIYFVIRLIAIRMGAKWPLRRGYKVPETLDEVLMEELEEVNKKYDKTKSRPFLWPF